VGEAAQARYNQRINDHFEGTRDYIVTHYKTNSRTDTDYWRANAANLNLSDPLKQLFGLWLQGRRIAPEISKGAIGHGYPVFSWYCILAGMGIFPDSDQLHPPDDREACYDLAEIDNLLERSALNFPDQRTLLGNIPVKRREKALQIYFW
jgi:hypothetical protein